MLAGDTKIQMGFLLLSKKKKRIAKLPEKNELEKENFQDLGIGKPTLPLTFDMFN